MARQQLSSAEECGEGLMVGARRADLSVLPMADQQGFLHCHTAPLETVAKKESIQSAGAVDVRGSEEEQYVKRLQPASAVIASLNKQPLALKQCWPVTWLGTSKVWWKEVAGAYIHLDNSSCISFRSWQNKCNISKKINK